MTEDEWLAGTDPRPMLEFLRGKVSDRKLRLLAAACCRRIWHRMHDRRSHRAVELTERHADDPSSGELRTALGRASADAFAVWGDWQLDEGVRLGGYAAAHAAYLSDTGRYADYCNLAVELTLTPSNRMARVATCKLVRDIFGNPFRPVTVDPGWLTSTVVSLAQPIYADRAFDRLPILADALEDAGCDSPELLAHCRGDGPHVRGCWAVDLVLGKKS